MKIRNLDKNDVYICFQSYTQRYPRKKKNSLEYNYECWLQIDTGIKHQEIKMEFAFYTN